jgi:hypothetical protein
LAAIAPKNVSSEAKVGAADGALGKDIADRISSMPMKQANINTCKGNSLPNLKTINLATPKPTTKRFW